MQILQLLSLPPDLLRLILNLIEEPEDWVTLKLVSKRINSLIKDKLTSPEGVLQVMAMLNGVGMHHVMPRARFYGFYVRTPDFLKLRDADPATLSILHRFAYKQVLNDIHHTQFSTYYLPINHGLLSAHFNTITFSLMELLTLFVQLRHYRYVNLLRDLVNAVMMPDGTNRKACDVYPELSPPTEMLRSGTNLQLCLLILLRSLIACDIKGLNLDTLALVKSILKSDPETKHVEAVRDCLVSLDIIFAARKEHKSAEDCRLICAGSRAHINLSGAMLVNINLEHAHFAGASLHFANFSNTNLNNADLRHADLSEVHFNDATVKHACIASAVLRHSIMTNANFSYADFSHSDLSEAIPFSTIFVGANFNRAWLGTLVCSAIGMPFFCRAIFEEANFKFSRWWRAASLKREVNPFLDHAVRVKYTQIAERYQAITLAIVEDYLRCVRIKIKQSGDLYPAMELLCHAINSRVFEQSGWVGYTRDTLAAGLLGTVGLFRQTPSSLLSRELALIESKVNENHPLK